MRCKVRRMERNNMDPVFLVRLATALASLLPFRSEPQCLTEDVAQFARMLGHDGLPDRVSALMAEGDDDLETAWIDYCAGRGWEVLGVGKYELDDDGPARLVFLVRSSDQPDLVFADFVTKRMKEARRKARRS